MMNRLRDAEGGSFFVGEGVDVRVNDWAAYSFCLRSIAILAAWSIPGSFSSLLASGSQAPEVMRPACIIIWNVLNMLCVFRTGILFVEIDNYMGLDFK